MKLFFKSIIFSSIANNNKQNGQQVTTFETSAAQNITPVTETAYNMTSELRH